MEGRGGCCLVRYAGEDNVNSKVDRIMLRFRPIAPKPASPGGSPPSGAAASETAEPCGKGGGVRAKRRSGKDGVGRRGRKRKSLSETGVVRKKVAEAEDPVTLQLMPETPERKESLAAEATTPSSPPDLVLPYVPAWYGPHAPSAADGSTAVVLAPTPVRPAGSWVTLECVTDTYGEAWVGEGRCTGEGARRALEGDACPAFVSDPCDRVTWTNTAYRRMVGSAEGGGVAVALVTGGRVPGGDSCGGGFTCRVRMRYAGRREKGSLTTPCDVWRLAGDGGLAWRLDVKAALLLGR